MARPRRARNVPNENQTPTEGNVKMSNALDDFTVDISDDELNAALAGSRTRGVYEENIMAFLGSGRRGVQVNLEDGVHEGKKSQSVKTGYESAREKIASGKVPTADEAIVEAAKNTKVIGKTNPDRVFLLRQDIQAQAA